MIVIFYFYYSICFEGQEFILLPSPLFTLNCTVCYNEHHDALSGIVLLGTGPADVLIHLSYNK